MLSFIRFSSSVSRALRTNKTRGNALRKMRRDESIKSLGPNPGLDNKINQLREENIDINEDIIQEVIDDEIINPYSMGRIYVDYEKEEEANHEKLVRSIVKNKYFPDIKLPNLLTWSEKEHIRYLHEQDPEEWTPEKISESYPVTTAVARKLLKVVWKPATINRIERHDASVIRNWKALKEGSLENVSPELRNQFLKFSNRIIPPRKEEDFINTIKLTNEERIFGEFSSIVAPKLEDNVPTNIQKLEQKQREKDHGNLATVEKYFINQNKHTTLSEIKEQLSTAVEENKQLHPLDQLIVQSKSNDSMAYSEVPTTELSSHFYSKSKSASRFGDLTETEPEVEETYFQRIRIPKAVYKKGKTYKINDCFYDHDGQFLYRVPGLTSQFKS